MNSKLLEDLERWGDKYGCAAKIYRDNNLQSHEEAWDWLRDNGIHGWLLFLACGDGVLSGKTLKQLGALCVVRSINAAKMECNDQAWNAWADKWLAGIDRGKKSAKTACKITQSESNESAYLASTHAYAYANDPMLFIKTVHYKGDLLLNLPNPFKNKEGINK